MQCRICFVEDNGKYVSPCACRGTMKWVHRSCLEAWINTRSGMNKVECPTCKTIYAVCTRLNVPIFNRERARRITRALMDLEEE